MKTEQELPVFSTEHEEPVKNEIARQLNIVLARAPYRDAEFARAALSIVLRVAHFEEIKRASP